MVTQQSIFQSFQYTVLNKERVDYADDKKLQNVMGQIINRKGIGISNRIVTMLAKNKTGFVMNVDTTRKDGSFSFLIPQNDSLQISLQVNNKHSVQTTFTDSIKIDNFIYPQLSTPSSLKDQYVNINSIALLQK